MFRQAMNSVISLQRPYDLIWFCRLGAGTNKNVTNTQASLGPTKLEHINSSVDFRSMKLNKPTKFVAFVAVNQ